MIIYIRNEIYPNELRTPIVPNDVLRLIAAGHSVVVQKSNTRAYTDDEYLNKGALITEEPWYEINNNIVLGLKELDHIEKLDNHTHVYFSHSYKGQINSSNILNAFSKSNSILHDLEYFTNPKGSRVLAFGYYAGVIGAVLGLRQNYNRKTGLPDIKDLKPWSSAKDLFDFCKSYLPSVAVIGKGRSAKGVTDVLNRLGIVYKLIDRQETIKPYDYDILFNCILLDESYNKTWINKEDTPQTDLLIVDISCDYSKHNNPIAIYRKPTSWADPVFNFSDKLSVISIDNLPSLLPRDSSTEFSYGLTDLLLNKGDLCWRTNLDKFQEACKRIGFS
jgi:saccharopine dehydrogenase (NAD+, L-lysine-forming)